MDTSTTQIKSHTNPLKYHHIFSFAYYYFLKFVQKADNSNSMFLPRSFTSVLLKYKYEIHTRTYKEMLPNEYIFPFFSAFTIRGGRTLI